MPRTDFFDSSSACSVVAIWRDMSGIDGPQRFYLREEPRSRWSKSIPVKFPVLPQYPSFDVLQEEDRIRIANALAMLSIVFHTDALVSYLNPFRSSLHLKLFLFSFPPTNTQSAAMFTVRHSSSAAFIIIFSSAFSGPCPVRILRGSSASTRVQRWLTHSILSSECGERRTSGNDLPDWFCSSYINSHGQLISHDPLFFYLTQPNGFPFINLLWSSPGVDLWDRLNGSPAFLNGEYGEALTLPSYILELIQRANDCVNPYSRLLRVFDGEVITHPDPKVNSPLSTVISFSIISLQKDILWNWRLADFLFFFTCKTHPNVFI